MLTAFNLFVVILFGVLVVGSLLPLSSSPHWFIRGWDYPRVQIVAIAIVAIVAFLAVNVVVGRPNRVAFSVMIGLALLIAGWHLFRILPYTPLMPTQAKAWNPPADAVESDPHRLRVLISNVEMENDQFTRWKHVMGDCDADVVIVAEVDERWQATLEELKSAYPHQIIYPQDNWYGLAMISRLPIIDSELRFLVQDDVPSIDAMIEMPSGDRVRVVGVHPRPPEPIRDNDATARDAELVLWGEELAKDNQPIVIGGDLNDVAWSQSTRLFLRLSELLDPRRGRGFFNSFHADRRWMRFPLDHVFHSTHFTIRDMKRLEHVGSDHFPIFIDLQLEPAAKEDQEPLDKKASDAGEADERIDRAEEDLGLDVESVREATTE
ncbi:hypothetical protein Pla52o_40620 [Novipirellula galeiformis]|uniref:Endonuclease/exonuclease/phosphatase domain-containing protein n=1 Tax=Novipirellula galeiformis TaxID=2528004 RepID=A0A5C6C8W9_9BACT|nr:endonuclease/exonuclease/phosphatase family protein [Novipirellula galeiformis]TWU21030.1 hypothetical protein Pla52o_40620 [Novipirellula galeiformis]